MYVTGDYLEKENDALISDESCHAHEGVMSRIHQSCLVLRVHVCHAHEGVMSDMNASRLNPGRLYITGDYLEKENDTLISALSSDTLPAGNSVLQCVAVGCGGLQQVAVCCSGLQYVAVGCSQRHAHQRPTPTPYLPVQCVAACCSVLKRVAVTYSVLQCTAMCCSVFQSPLLSSTSFPPSPSCSLSLLMFEGLF